MDGGQLGRVLWPLLDESSTDGVEYLCKKVGIGRKDASVIGSVINVSRLPLEHERVLHGSDRGGGLDCLFLF